MRLRIIYGCLLGIWAAGAVAQPRAAFDKKVHDFGEIQWKAPVTARFKVTNTGDKPLVISKVTSSCGCTVAGWTRQPIAPGDNGVVEATFDTKAVGRFHKSVGVFCNAESKPVYLTIKGKVSTEVKDYSAYPVQIGTVRIDRNELEFMEVARSSHPVEEIRVVNTSDQIYEPVLMHLPPYLRAEAIPVRLAKRRAGVIRVTLDPDKLSGHGLTQTSVYLARFSGDKVSEENEIVVSAVRVPDFSSLSEAERRNAPAMHLSATELDMSGHDGKKKVTQKITLSNQGKRRLDISSLQVYNPAIEVSLKKRYIEPGASTVMKVTLHPEMLKRHKAAPKLLMVTNDPQHPTVVINLKTKK